MANFVASDLPCPSRLVLFPNQAAARAMQPVADTMGTTFVQLQTWLVEPKTGVKSERPRRQLGPFEQQRLIWGLGDFRSGYPLAAVAAARRQTATLIQLRRLGISPPSLEHFMTQHDDLIALVQCYKSYNKVTKQFGLDDEADVFEHVCWRLRKGDLPDLLQGVKEIVVGSACEVMGETLRLVEAMAARFKVVVHVAYNASYPGATRYAEALLTLLEARPELDIEVVTQNEDVLPAWLLARDAYVENYEQRLSVAVAAGALCCQRVAQGEEAVLAAVKQIHMWIEQGYPPHALAIIIPAGLTQHVGAALHGRDLLRRLEQAFKTAGIPCRSPGSKPWRQTVLGRLILNFIQLGCAENICEASQSKLPACVLADCIACFAQGVQRQDGLNERANGSNDVKASLALAQSLRQLGPRTLSIKELAHAVGQLGGHSAETAYALLTWYRRWVQPLTSQPSVADICHHLVDVLEAVGTEEVAAADLLYDTLGELARAEGCVAHLGLASLVGPHACAWVATALRGLQLKEEVAAAGIQLLSPQAALGQPFVAVLWWGANEVWSKAAAAHGLELRKPVQRALDRGLGQRWSYGLSQCQVLGAGVRDVWLWRHIAVQARSAFVMMVFDTGNEQEDVAAPQVEEVVASCAVKLTSLEPSYTHVLPEAATQREMLHHLAHVGGACETANWHMQLLELDDNHQPLAQLVRRVVHARSLQSTDAVALYGEAQQALRAEMLSRVHGASGLEMLGLCRFRHFAGHVLQLEAPSVWSAGLGPRERGSADHRALYLVLAGLYAEHPLAVWQQQPAAARARAQQLFHRHAHSIVLKASLHARLRDAALAHAWQAVSAQLESDLAEQGIEAVQLEVSFGRRDGTPELVVSHPFEQGMELRVSGAIDRIDRRGGELWIIDYKSSLPRRKAGRHYQLGLYQMAAVHALKHRPKTLAAAWVALGVGGTTAKARCLPKELQGSVDEVLERSSQELWARLDPYLAGYIAPDPEPRAVCSSCDFSALCRVAQIEEETTDEGSFDD